MTAYLDAFPVTAARMPSAWAVQAGSEIVCLTDNEPEARALARRLYAFHSQTSFLGEVPRTARGLAAFLSGQGY